MTSVISAPSDALETLLAGLIDYAGLFPPAALDMGEAVSQYRHAELSGDRAALGRFVVPAGRLDEFTQVAVRHPAATGWRLSVLIGEDVSGDVHRVAAANAYFGSTGLGHVADCAELRASTPLEAAERLAEIPPAMTRYVEFPVTDEPEPYLDLIAAAGAAAKIRMGGVVAEAFPAATDVMRFLRACVRQGVAFKATAGLHHPIRGAYPLTYAPGADLIGMYGYLNLFLAAAALYVGAPSGEAQLLLMEHDPTAFRVLSGALVWRERLFPTATLQDVRNHLAIGIGSCSFREPLDDLRTLGVR